MSNGRSHLAKARVRDDLGSDGFAGGTLLGSIHPWLVPLDLEMPGMDGRDGLRFIRRTESLSDVRVLVISAMPRQELAATLDIGVDAWLGNTISVSDLTNSVMILKQKPEQEAV